MGDYSASKMNCGGYQKNKYADPPPHIYLELIYQLQDTKVLFGLCGNKLWIDSQYMRQPVPTVLDVPIKTSVYY